MLDLEKHVDNFKGGQLSRFYPQWGKKTTDKSILNIIKGDNIYFESSPPIQHYAQNAKFTSVEEHIIQLEIEKLLKKGVIKESYHEKIEFVSPIFITPKSDGGTRLILNLKKLNKSIKYEHFKMSTINSVLNMVSQNCYMSKIDLKDAYYSVKIDEDFQKYLKFSFKDKLYQYTCFPNGLGPCPRKFTKITKVPTSTLRVIGIPICGYIDDFFTKDKSYEKCYDNVIEITKEFQSLGFVIHPEKSIFKPSQVMTFLGFVINSRKMLVTLTEQKEKNLRNLVSKLLNMKSPSIRFVAKVVGTLVSSFPAIKFAPLHYRYIEKVKSEALTANKGNFEATCTLTDQAICDLKWWKNAKFSKWIHPPCITLEIMCDASTGGNTSTGAWGAICNNIPCGGAWNVQEQSYHINVRELLAIYYALRAFLPLCVTKHVKIYSDSTAAVGIVNKMGTSKNILCNEIAKKLWYFCEQNNIWVTATHIPGVDNVSADTESRKEYKEAEWKLNKTFYEFCTKTLNFIPNLDCFASRLNAQLDTYVSRRPDPFAKFVDAFSLNWKSFNCYLFPPFSLVGRVLQKIRIDQAKVMLVVPYWPTQPWFTTYMEMLIQEPIILSPMSNLLILPQNQTQLHPLATKLHLMVGILCDKNT